MTTAQLDLGIGTSQAEQGLKDFVKAIRDAKTELQSLLSATQGASAGNPLGDLQAAVQAVKQAAQQGIQAQQQAIQAHLTDMQSAGKKIVADAKTTADQVVKTNVEANKKIADDAKRTAGKVKASFSQSLGNGISVSMNIKPETAVAAANGNINAILSQNATVAQAFSERERREAALRAEVTNTQIAMLRGEAERQAQARLTGQIMVQAELERAAEAKRTYVAMQIAEVERQAEGRRTGQVMVMAEIERRAEGIRTANEMRRAELDRQAEGRRTGQTMVMAELDRAKAAKLAGDEMRAAEILRNRELTIANKDAIFEQLSAAGQLRRAMTAQSFQQKTGAPDALVEERFGSLAANANIKELQDRVAKLKTDTKELTAEQLSYNDALKNAKFDAQTPVQQFRTARVAQGFEQRQGTQAATDAFGSAAVGADLGQLAQAARTFTEEQKRLNGEVRNGVKVKGDAAAYTRNYRDALNEAHSAARGLAGGLGALWLTWGSAIPLMAGAAITGSLAAMFKQGKDVELQLQFIRALSDEVSREPVNLDGFLKVTEGTVSSVKDAAAGMRLLAQSGLDQQQALRALPDILNLAAIGEMSVGQAALAATGVAQAFNVQMTEMGKVGDIFAKIAASSNTSVIGMTESMKQASTVGEQFHVSIEEAAASMGVLAQRNIINTAAGTSLTNALKGLYEPSKQAAQALKQVGIETGDGNGGLKNYTQLLDDLRKKLAGLNDEGKTKFLGTVTDQRGAKTISAITEQWDKYQKMLFDAKTASHFMSEATLQLEDTVDKSSQRIGNSLEVSFIKGFAAASPVIRSVQEQLDKIARSDDTVNMFAKLAVGMAKIVETAVEHRTAIGLLIAGYVGLRVVSSATTAIEAFVVAQKAAAAATATVTPAIVTFGGALRMAVGALGPLAIAIGVAYTAYEILTAKTDATNEAQRKLNQTNLDNEMTQRRINSTADLTISFYDRQIAKLRELNNELRNHGREAQTAALMSTRAALQELMVRQQQHVEELERGQKDKNGTTLGNGDRVISPGTLSSESPELKRARAALAESKERLRKFVTGDITLAEEASTNLILQGRADTSATIDRILQSIRDDDKHKGQERVQQLVKRLNDLQIMVANDDGGYLKAASEIKSIQDELNKIREPFKPVDNKALNDAYRAKQQSLDNQLAAIKRESQSLQQDFKNQAKTGVISDIEAIEQIRTTKINEANKELEIFRQKLAVASQADKDGMNKKTDQEKIRGKTQERDAAILEANKEAEREKAAFTATVNQQIFEEEKKTYADRGLLVAAYLYDYEAKYGKTIRQIQSALDSTKVPEDTKTQLRGVLDLLIEMQNAGVAKAQDKQDKLQKSKTREAFDEAKGEYEALFAEMQQKIESVNAAANVKGGISTAINAAQAAEDIRAHYLPALTALQNKLQGDCHFRRRQQAVGRHRRQAHGRALQRRRRPARSTCGEPSAARSKSRLARALGAAAKPWAA
jgi:TP901 family phage tail tape measure protein